MLILLMALLLTSCWIPEKFNVNINVKDDGSSSFVYDGVIAFGPALEAATKGKLKERDEERLKKKIEKIKKDSNVKKVDYLGKGRYQVLIEKEIALGEHYNLMNFFKINSDKNGTITIKGAKINAKTEKELNSIGAKVEGTINLSIEDGVKIINDNIDNKPKFFGLFGGYSWDITSKSKQPTMTLQTNPKDKK